MYLGFAVVVCCWELDPGFIYAKRASLSCPHSPVSARFFGVLYMHYHFNYNSESVAILCLIQGIVSLGECATTSLGESCCPEASHSTIEVWLLFLFFNRLEGSLGAGAVWQRDLGQLEGDTRRLPFCGVKPGYCFLRSVLPAILLIKVE